MEIVRINGELGIRITYENLEGIKKRITLSLKKIAITGLLAIGIPASIKPIANEVSFKLEQGKIENLKETADEISKLDNNTTIVDGEEIKIADKVIELAEKREAYNNAKHDKSDKEKLESLKEEIRKLEQQINVIGLNEIKEQAAAATHFGNREDTILTIKRENNLGNQNDYIVQEKVITEGLNQTRVEVDSYELNNKFAGNAISGNTYKVIEQMPEFLQDGLELSEDGKTLREKK